MTDAASRRVIVALDTPYINRATSLARAVAPSCGFFKLGLEFFLANGHPGVLAIEGRPILLDLKLHDIPNTVAGAVRSVLSLRPAMLTVHAAGGAAMISAARTAIDGSDHPRPLLLAVTVLTSLNGPAMRETGISGDPSGQVLRLAKLAVSAGADGIVCSPLEVNMLRDVLGTGPRLVVPGVRRLGDEVGDQARTTTAREAIDRGADWVVIGRPITSAADPRLAAAGIVEELAA